MLGNIFLVSSLFSGAALAAAVPRSGGNSISATPHDAYSSSIGVLGCLINTNRVAYWPTIPDCNNLCKKVTYGDRSLHILHIDKSEGAHDMSFDAWNELVFGVSATEGGQPGGPETMTYEDVPMTDPECLKLLKTDGKLPLSAANSMNYIANCIDLFPDQWVAQNIETYNIGDPVCGWGYMEKCNLAYPTNNTMNCPSDNGRDAAAIHPLDAEYHVINIKYPDGSLADAADPSAVVSGDQTSGASSLTSPSGAAFAEKKGDSSEGATKTTTATPTSSPTGALTPFQALVVLGATLKNMLKES